MQDTAKLWDILWLYWQLIVKALSMNFNHKGFKHLRRKGKDQS